MNHDETVEYYRQRADEYEKAYFRDNPARQSELAGLYSLSRRVLKGRRVLDLACGTGFWTRIIAEQAESVTGIDINRETIAHAKQKTYCCPVQFVQSDFFDLSFPAGTFDGLLATFVVSHVRRQDHDRLAERVRGVVKAGSPAFICDNNIICEFIPQLVWDKEHLNSYKKRRLEDGREYEILKNYYDKDELAAIFERWGNIEKINVNTYYWSVVLNLK